MTTESQEPGGIRAKRIQADNVVTGVQFQGGDQAQAAALVQLAQAIKGGAIQADDITARNIVSGLQYIADPATASTEDLRKELAAFQIKLDQAIAAKELPTAGAVQDAKESLASAQSELAQPQPDGERVVRKLDEVSKIVTRGAEIAQASGKIGSYVVQLAPVAAVLWQVAQRIFGL